MLTLCPSPTIDPKIVWAFFSLELILLSLFQLQTFVDYYTFIYTLDTLYCSSLSYKGSCTHHTRYWEGLFFYILSFSLFCIVYYICISYLFSPILLLLLVSLSFYFTFYLLTYHLLIWIMGWLAYWWVEVVAFIAWEIVSWKLSIRA